MLLDHVEHYQAHSVACRALFEMAIDVVLICDNPGLAETLITWGKSAKLNGAQRLLEEHPTSKLEPEARRFVKRYGKRIEQDRQTCWNTTKHKMRWTKRSLPEDAKRADRIENNGLKAFYFESYYASCLSTHGSGVAIEESLDKAGMIAPSIVYLDGAARFAKVVARKTLEHFGKLDADRADILQKLDDLAYNRTFLDRVESILERDV